MCGAVVACWQGSGDRVFYESLFKQRPSSEMALIFCVEYGIFPLLEAEERYQQYLQVRVVTALCSQQWDAWPTGAVIAVLHPCVFSAVVIQVKGKKTAPPAAASAGATKRAKLV